MLGIAVSSQKTDEMRGTPINPAWVIEGRPVERSAMLLRRRDNTCHAYLWECSSGVFHWHYELDETLYVLEGLAVVQEDNGTVHRLGPGDCALFCAGSHAVWRVENYVRKVAFIREPVPSPLMFVIRVVRKVKRSTRHWLARGYKLLAEQRTRFVCKQYN